MKSALNLNGEKAKAGTPTARSSRGIRLLETGFRSHIRFSIMQQFRERSGTVFREGVQALSGCSVYVARPPRFVLRLSSNPLDHAPVTRHLGMLSWYFLLAP